MFNLFHSFSIFSHFYIIHTKTWLFGNIFVTLGRRRYEKNVLLPLHVPEHLILSPLHFLEAYYPKIDGSMLDRSTTERSLQQGTSGVAVT